MNFGQAIDALKAGKRVCRGGWNGKGMWLVLVPGSDVNARVGTPYGEALGHGVAVKINAHIDMRTATGEMQPGWLASQTDMLADDWMTVGDDGNRHHEAEPAEFDDGNGMMMSQRAD